MKTEDAFVLAPLIGIIGGLAAYFMFDVPAVICRDVGVSCRLSPYILMAALIVIVKAFFGGFDNDRPPCEVRPV